MLIAITYVCPFNGESPAMIIANYLKDIGYRPRGIVHVGAHLAEEMKAYLDLNPDLIVWIEALPDCAAHLRRMIKEDPTNGARQRVVEALITDCDGDRRSFFVFSNNGESSSIFHGSQILRDTWPTLSETGEQLELVTSRLETALDKAGVKPEDIDVLVLDIQGAEVLALAGAGSFLASSMFVESEVSLAPVYEGGPLADEVIGALGKAGFTPVTEIPWHGDVVFSRNTISSRSEGSRSG